MFDNKSDIVDQILNTPLNAPALALQEIEDRLNGKYYVADPNSPFVVLLEYGATLMEIAHKGQMDTLRAMYERRSQTMNDLLKHMSDYDYVGMYSTPATTILQLTLSKTYLANNALSYNDNYKKVIIPKHTVFAIGKYSFGIHYPIEIRINKLTKSTLTIWDTSETNPLHTLSSNLLDTVESNIDSSLELLHINIPVQQFFKATDTQDLITQTGFAKTYQFNFNFWAVRAFSVTNGVYTEMSLALTKDTYDPTVLTACILIDIELSTLTVEVPQIYFTNGLMGKQLYIEVYTTFGKLNVDLSNVTGAEANFQLTRPDTDPYARVLKNITTIDLTTTENLLVGGSNGYGFEELRQRVINNNFYGDVPITPADLNKYINDAGFNSYKYLDNLTDRVYIAHQLITDTDNQPIPSAMTGVYFSPSSISDVSTIKTNPDGSYTILPTTLYSFDMTTQLATPLTDEKMSYFSQLTKTDRVAEFNNSIYTFTPFHTHLLASERYPRAVSYNLLSTKVSALTFIESNDEVAAQILVAAATIVHQEGGVGGYLIELVVDKSTDMTSVNEDDIYLLVSVYDSEGVEYTTRATYNRTLDKYYVYQVTLSTDYWINANGDIHITNLAHDDITQSVMLPLENKYYVTCLVKNTNFSSTANNNTFAHLEGVPDTLLNTHIVLLKQSMIFHLGHALKDVLYNRVTPIWSAQQYATYQADVPAYYTAVDYARDALGNILYQIVDGKVVFTVSHNVGDPVLDTEGNPVYLHKKGDIIYDANKEPIVLTDREVIYATTIMQFDARIQLSEDSKHITFRNTLTDTLEGYFTSIRSVQNQLLERTNLYFQPTRTIGYCAFSLGDGIVQKYNLYMSFSVKYYVRSFVDSDTKIKAEIRKVTIDMVTAQLATGKICMATTFEAIRTKLSDYVVSVDVYGIDGTSTLQTLVSTEDDAQPIVAQILTVSRTEHVSLEPNITIDFVVADETK